MFYDNIYKICNDKGTTPTTVLKELGFSSGNVSKWKNGSVPNVEMCLAIARKLNVSLDYPMRRKTPCFNYGDIRRVHRIYASN